MIEPSFNRHDCRPIIAVAKLGVIAMGLLDSLVTSVMQSMTSGQQSQALPGLLSQVLGQSNLGSIGGLLAQLQSAGLGRQVASWLGNGTNMPIDQHQLHRALGDDNLQQMSGASGLPIDQLLKVLAHGLPGAVDQLSPHGVLQEDQIDNSQSGQGPEDDAQSGSLAQDAGVDDIK